MALKKKPVTGMKDMLPAEMEIRDYVIQMIKDTYKTFGFVSIETPCVEHIENLCSKQGGDNEKLIFNYVAAGNSIGVSEGQLVYLSSYMGVDKNVTVKILSGSNYITLDPTTSRYWAYLSDLNSMYS